MHMRAGLWLWHSSKDLVTGWYLNLQQDIATLLTTLSLEMHESIENEAVMLSFRLFSLAWKDRQLFLNFSNLCSDIQSSVPIFTRRSFVFWCGAGSPPTDTYLISKNLCCVHKFTNSVVETCCTQFGFSVLQTIITTSSSAPNSQN